jgi:hypothetical protein
VSPEVTIRISTGDAATVSAVGGGQPMAPMSIEELQAGAAASSPAPQDVATLAAGSIVAGAALAGSEPPRPMSIEQLHQAAAGAAPAPQAFGALEGAAGLPTPRPIEELGGTGTGSAPGAPGPVPSQPLTGARPRSTRSRGTTRSTRTARTKRGG